MSKKDKIDVVVPISEHDIEYFKDLLYGEEEFNWTFESIDGKHNINISFVKEEYDEENEDDE